MMSRPLQEVLTEIAQRYGRELNGELLVLVFHSSTDRKEFIAAVQEAKPGMCEFHIPLAGRT
jgi:hypothetical protein